MNNLVEIVIPPNTSTENATKRGTSTPVPKAEPALGEDEEAAEEEEEEDADDDEDEDEDEVEVGEDESVIFCAGR